MYTSIETGQLLPDGNVEWVMATASDAKGTSCPFCHLNMLDTRLIKTRLAANVGSEAWSPGRRGEGCGSVHQMDQG